MVNKILLLDDDINFLKLLSFSLKRAKYEIVTEENGEKALETVNTLKPDLIISDIQMPVMDGFEFCKKIRSASSIPLVPLIIYSSLKEPQIELEAYRSGANLVLTKPIDRDLLLVHVNNFLNQARKYQMNAGSGKVIEEDHTLSGSLKDISLIEIMQFISSHKFSGILKILDGVLFFQKGEIIKAVYKELKNESVINELVKVNDGYFYFKTETIDFEPEISANTMQVLMEACRLMDEDSANS
ncbi:MAG: response regulator [Calditrichaeota bacterium]|nr:response regulator [Calditrichota bacterium]